METLLKTFADPEFWMFFLIIMTGVACILGIYFSVIKYRQRKRIIADLKLIADTSKDFEMTKILVDNQYKQVFEIQDEYVGLRVKKTEKDMVCFYRPDYPDNQLTFNIKNLHNLLICVAEAKARFGDRYQGKRISIEIKVTKTID